MAAEGVLVLDEPTAVLPHDEVERLFAVVREVRKAGTAILYVSHRMDEIFELADRVTILRGGRLVATHDIADLDPRALAGLMVGEDVDPDYRAPVAAKPDAPVVLEARDVAGSWLRGVDLDVHQGEILGIAGLAGAGVLELPYVIAGHAPRGDKVTGRLRLPQRVRRVARRRRGQGRRHPARPRRPRSARASSPSSPSARTSRCRSSAGSAARGRLGQREEARVVEEWSRRLDVKTETPGALISTLSGGNQQKVVVARCLVSDPELLVLCEPTAGVDIGTRVAIYDLIARLAREGLTVIVSSSDEGDLLAMCTRDRGAAGRHGRRELSGDGLTEHALVSAMEGESSMTHHQDIRSGAGVCGARQPLPAPPDRPPASRRLASGLAFDKIGAVYVWLAIIIVFSIWVPDTFPNAGHGQADPQRQRDHRAGRAGDHDPALGARVRPLVRVRHDAHRRRRRAARHGRHARSASRSRIGLLVGVGIGVINASVVVVVMRIDSFIGTLATGSLIPALITMVTNDTPITDAKLAGAFAKIGQTSIGGVTLPVFYCAVVAVAIWYLLEHTATGRRLYATGFNPDAARLAGVRVDRLRFVSLVASGGLAGATGIVLASMLGSGSPTAGTPYLLPAFAAAFLGATQLKHGRFNAGGHDHRRPAARHRHHRPRAGQRAAVVAAHVRRRRPDRRARRDRPPAAHDRERRGSGVHGAGVAGTDQPGVASGTPLSEED